MNLIVISIRDSKSNVFGRPFYAQTVGSAIRTFDDEVNRRAEDNILNRHPQDFQLFQIATWNDATGSFEVMTPKLLVDGNSVIKRGENNVQK